MAKVCRQTENPTDKIKVVIYNWKIKEMDYVIQGDEWVGPFFPHGAILGQPHRENLNRSRLEKDRTHKEDQ